MENITDKLKQHAFEKKYCVYLHKLPMADRVVYVGEGTLDRAYNFNRPDQWAWSAVFEAFDPVVEIVARDLTKKQAEYLEKKLIEFHRKTIINDPNASKTAKEIRFELVDEFVYYDETSPTFLRWKADMRNNAKANAPAGHITKKSKGYCYVEIAGQSFAIHRVVWVLHNGAIDTDVFVDHIDGDRKNNKITNLRLTNPKLNSHNTLRKVADGKYRNIKENIINGEIKSFSIRWHRIEDNKRLIKTFNVKEFGGIHETFMEAYKFRDYLISVGCLSERIKEGEKPIE